jgi:hypothetical protein
VTSDDEAVDREPVDPEPVDPEPGDAEPFSVQLERWLTTDQSKTMGELSQVFGERSFAVMVLVLMFLPALPLPTGGLTHIFEVITILLAGQMVLGRRTIWLPARWRQRELGPTMTEKAVPFIVRRVRWFERRSRPRAAWLFERRWFIRLLGVLLIAFALGALFAPPFSGLDTVPALGAVIVALSIVLSDVLVLAVGVVVGTGGIVLIATLGAAAVRLVRELF